MRQLFGIFIFTTVIGLGAEPPADIPSLAKRADSVQFARSLISSESDTFPPLDSAAIKNPFNPVAAPAPVDNSSTNNVVVPVVTEVARLEQIAPGVNPTGSIKIGDEAFLLFGQKRLKVGDQLPIIFEGKPYQLEIVGIQSTNFTLRLNGVEITRPIKSVH